MSDKSDTITLLEDCSSEYLETRIKAYHVLTEKFSLGNQQWGESCKKEQVEQIVSNLSKDIFCNDRDASFEATGFLGCFLANENLMDILSVKEEQEILDGLINLLENIKENSILTRGLWSLAQSKFNWDVYKANLSKILCLINFILEKDQSSITIYETLQVLKSVMEAIPLETLKEIGVWFPKMFGFLFHDDMKIRGVTYSCINTCRGLNNNEGGIARLKEHLTPFVVDLKTKYCRKMVKFIEEECSFVLKIWRLLVMILGKDLHSGTVLINSFLEVVEKAFKSSKFDIRIDAFKCWHTLIGNFATDLNVLSHPKRLKLLIAPLKSNNAKTEEISSIKLITWWYFIGQLKEKAVDNFDMIVVPFFRFCFNPSTMTASGATERMFLLSATASPCRKYSSLHVKTAEILARVLSVGMTYKSRYIFSIAGLTNKLITPAIFLKNYLVIFGCVEDALTTLDPTNLKQEQLGYLILECVIYHTVSMFLFSSNKKEYHIDIVKDLFGMFSVIESHCNTGDSLSLFAFKFLELTCMGETSLPQSVITSRLYHIPTGTKVRDLMNGTLSNFLIHKLCRPVLLHIATVDKDRFLQLWESVLIKSKASDRLVLLETVIEEMKDTTSFLCPQHEDVLISLWNITAKFLDSHIEETSVLHQGDNQEQDWNCIYSTLLFPIMVAHDHLSSTNNKSYESMLKVWSTLWKHFTMMTMLSTSVEGNCEAEFVARKMLALAAEKLNAPPDAMGSTLTFFADVVAVIVDNFRFKEIGKKPKKMLQSPLKPNKKSHPLNTLSGVVELVDFLMEKAVRMISSHRHHMMHKLCSSASKIFMNIPNDKLVWPLITNLFETIHKALQINPTAKFNLEVERSFLEMWDSLCRLIETRLSSKLTKDQLAYLAPLFYVALQSSHTGLRKRTRQMWSSAFASTSLPIPDRLFEVLKGLGLPPASISDVVEESQSFSPKENIPVCGSFLNRKDWPSAFTPVADKKVSTPLSKKTPKSTKKSSAVKSLQLQDMNEEDFVKVDTPKQSRRVLTHHQAEKMKKRVCDIPAMYNDNSSQCSRSQLPSQFICYDSQDNSSMNVDEHVDNKLVSLSKKKSVASLNFSEVMKNDVSDNSILLSQSETENSPKTTNGFRKSNTKSPLKKQVFITNETQKRKSTTPKKKSLDDVRKSLKGKLSVKKRSKKSAMLTEVGSSGLDSENGSPLASPLKGSQSPSKTIGRSFSINNSTNLSEVVSDDEIPSSQKDNCLNSLLLTPKSLERPKRKRKFKFNDDEIFVTTPSKKSKTSPEKGSDSVIILDNSNVDVTPSTDKIKTNDFNNFKLVPSDTEVIASPQNLQQQPVRKQNKTTIVESPSSEQSVLKNEIKIKRDEQPKTDKEKSNIKSLTNVKETPLIVPEKNVCLEAQVSETNSLPTLESVSPDKQSNLSKENLTPSKLSRSGRRIVAPNRDMPEPMTPPSAVKSKLFSVSESSTNSSSKSCQEKQDVSDTESPIAAKRIVFKDNKTAKVVDSLSSTPLPRPRGRPKKKSVIQEQNSSPSSLRNYRKPSSDNVHINDNSKCNDHMPETEIETLTGSKNCQEKSIYDPKTNQISPRKVGRRSRKSNTLSIGKAPSPLAVRRRSKRSLKKSETVSSEEMDHSNVSENSSSGPQISNIVLSKKSDSAEEKFDAEGSKISNTEAHCSNLTAEQVKNSKLTPSPVAYYNYGKSSHVSGSQLVFINSPKKTNSLSKSPSISASETLYGRLSSKGNAHDISSGDRDALSLLSKINFNKSRDYLQKNNEVSSSMNSSTRCSIMTDTSKQSPETVHASDQNESITNYLPKESSCKPSATLPMKGIISSPMVIIQSPKKSLSTKFNLSKSEAQGNNMQLLIVKSKYSASTLELSSLSKNISSYDANISSSEIITPVNAVTISKEIVAAEDTISSAEVSPPSQSAEKASDLSTKVITPHDNQKISSRDCMTPIVKISPLKKKNYSSEVKLSPFTKRISTRNIVLPADKATSEHITELPNVVSEAPVFEPSDATVFEPSDATVSKLSDATVSKPSDLTVSKPSDVTVSKPSDVTVSKPSDLTVSKPSDVTVSKPSDVTVSKPSDLTVSKPSDVTVSKPSDVTVSKPFEVTVSKPSDLTVSKPSDVTVSKPFEVTVSKPSDLIVSKPSDLTVSKPSDLTVSKPSDLTVSKPSDVTVSKPFEVTVSKPFEVAVSKPSEATVSELSEATVLKPSEATVLKPSKATVLNPSEETVHKPSEATVLKPSEATVLKPSEATVLKPSEATVLKPSEATALKPSEATALKPSEATVLKPSEATVLKPSEATILKPSEATVLKPSAATVSKASEATVSEQSEATVSEPSEATVSELSEATVSKPFEATVSKPFEATISKPSEATVSKPFKATLSEPSKSTISESSTTREVVANSKEKIALIKDILLESITSQDVSSTFNEGCRTNSSDASLMEVGSNEGGSIINSTETSENNTVELKDSSSKASVSSVVTSSDSKQNIGDVITSVNEANEDVLKVPEEYASSNLVNTVGTPERKKFMLKPQIPNSRAAMMLAYAKRTMKTRNDDNVNECPVEKGVVTPTNTPPHKKRKLSESLTDSKPWRKHEPSPKASPCSSILKRKFIMEEEPPATVSASEIGENASPTVSKNRRVSFADPPVSESVEIPPSPKTLRGIRALKKLDMGQAIVVKECSEPSQDEELMGVLNCSQPIYPALVDCEDSIGLLASMLTSSALYESLLTVLNSCGYQTVGEFCSISEAELVTLPIRAPKVAGAKKCLKRYLEIVQNRDRKQSDQRIQKLKRKFSTDSSETPSKSNVSSTHEDEVTPEDEDKLKDVITTISDSKIISNETCSSSDSTENEFYKNIWRNFESNTDTIPSFINGLCNETRYKLLQSLINVLPHQQVLDTFFGYLKTQGPK